MNAPQTATEQHDPITQSMMKTLRLQRDDFTAEGHVSAQVRIDRLNRGIAAVAKHQDRLVEAMYSRARRYAPPLWAQNRELNQNADQGLGLETA